MDSDLHLASCAPAPKSYKKDKDKEYYKKILLHKKAEKQSRNKLLQNFPLKGLNSREQKGRFNPKNKEVTNIKASCGKKLR